MSGHNDAVRLETAPTGGESPTFLSGHNSGSVIKFVESSTIGRCPMKIVRITLLVCLAAVWLVGCGQDTVEPPSPDPVDSLNNEDDIDNYHHAPLIVAVWKALGKNPLKATKAELATVTRLPQVVHSGFISQRGIDLLAACVNLVELEIEVMNLSNEQLAALAGLTKLKSLKLSANRISDLTPLARFTNLEVLDISVNRISDLSPLAGLVNLLYLDLHRNEIVDLRPLAGLVQLERLDLEDNEIADLSPLVGLVQLERFKLKDNQIVDLSPLAGLVHLPSLDLGDNQIADLSPLAGLIHLPSLDLGGNQIVDLSPLAGLVNLRDLDLRRNEISDLSPLAGLVQLDSLYLPNNEIVDLSPLVGLVQLERLSLRRNKIVDIQPLLDNIGIGAGDVIQLQENPLSDISRNQHIPALEARGVTVWQ